MTTEYTQSITELFSTAKVVHVAAICQRDYSWSGEQCRALFRTVTEAIKDGNEHFIGIIYFEGNNESDGYSLIDGQQRLTSISLLLKAALAADFDNEERIQIESGYLFYMGDYDKCKLHLNENDDTIYQLIMEDGELSANQKQSCLYQNYKLFCDLTRKYISDGGTAGDILKAVDKLTVTLMTATWKIA